MKVTAIETIRLTAQARNQLWVEVHTDEGLVGLGETFYHPATVAAYIHEVVAPYLIGRDPLQIERHARFLNAYLGFSSTSAEMRGNSAVDIALWDLFGKGPAGRCTSSSAGSPATASASTTPAPAMSTPARRCSMRRCRGPWGRGPAVPTRTWTRS